MYVNIRWLYEEINSGRKRNHGFCFVNPASISPSTKKAKSKNVDDAARHIAQRLKDRSTNDIVIVPYNPGFELNLKIKVGL
jgi:hypothetical protein